LLLVALIWGFDFVAQRQGVLGSGAFFFNAASFCLGAAVIGIRRCVSPKSGVSAASTRKAGILAGLALFAAMSFQSSGMATTGAGKAAFITSLYIVLVPVLGMLFGLRSRREIWIGCLFAVAGLYFLCVHEDLSLDRGDLLVLACALFWALQILLVDRFSSSVDKVGFALWQFLTCAALSVLAYLGTESVTLAQARSALFPILYNGIMTAGVAFSLQISGQSRTSAGRSALILSLETVFAAAGGWLLLHERFGLRELLGSALMLCGVVIARRGGGESAG
jgi:drug/metabolite transporter (DMT)-like permease